MHVSWTTKTAEHQRTDAFEWWCWRRLLRVPWTARRSNQSVVNEISSEYSLEGLMLKVKLPILWPHDAKNWLIWKDHDAGKDWRWEKRTTEDEMNEWHHWLNGHEFEETPGVGDGQGGLACCGPWGCKESGTTEWLKWTEMRTGGHLSYLPTSYTIVTSFKHPFVIIENNCYIILQLSSHLWFSLMCMYLCTFVLVCMKIMLSRSLCGRFLSLCLIS